MRKSRYSEGQIIGFIKQADAGVNVAELCRKEGFQHRHVLQVASEVRRHGCERRQAAARAGGGAGQRSAEGGLRGKALSPPAKRRALGKMLEGTKISERRACALVSLARDSWRRPPRRAEADRSMSGRIIELAHERRRFGYRRIGDLIRAQGTAINDKRSTGCIGSPTSRCASAGARTVSSSSACPCTSAGPSRKCGAWTS